MVLFIIDDCLVKFCCIKDCGFEFLSVGVGYCIIWFLLGLSCNGVVW